MTQYKTPELTELAPAIHAIQMGNSTTKVGPIGPDGNGNEGVDAYADWE
jgi:hypothetical protein